jgi:cytochrome c peroxidase
VAFLPYLLLFGVQVPLGLDSFVPAPPDNPLRPDSIALGRRLFFEKRLSRDGTLACASCHDPARAFTDQQPRARGIDGKIGPRRSPRILNRAWGKSFFWDGRASTLEDQVVQPITNPIEMAMPLDGAVTAVLADYPGLDVSTLRRALASYVRTIMSGDSPYDRYLAGNPAALDTQQLAGLAVFRGKGNCISCHLGPNLTDEDFHVTGAGAIPDDGRFAVTRNIADKGAFKTPSLRQVAMAPPYFHDGSAESLEAAVDHYDRGGKPDLPNLDGEIRPLRLTPDEKKALVAFLHALTGTVREGL